MVDILFSSTLCHFFEIDIWMYVFSLTACILCTSVNRFLEVKSMKLARLPQYIYSSTTSWGLWKHHFGIPGVRPMFLKPKLHKESKNGFKTINYRPSLLVIFSNYFFRHQKSSKKWNGFTSNQFPNHLNSIKCSINIFSDIRTT